MKLLRTFQLSEFMINRFFGNMNNVGRSDKRICKYDNKWMPLDQNGINFIATMNYAHIQSLSVKCSVVSKFQIWRKCFFLLLISQLNNSVPDSSVALCNHVSMTQNAGDKRLNKTQWIIVYCFHEKTNCPYMEVNDWRRIYQTWASCKWNPLL